MKHTLKLNKNQAVRYLTVLLMAGGSWLTACTPVEQTTVDYTVYVDPFIGTGGHGHTFPGPVVPRGMVQPGPDTGIPVPVIIITIRLSMVFLITV